MNRAFQRFLSIHAVVLASSVLTFAMPSESFGHCATEQCREATRWQDHLVAISLSDSGETAAHAAAVSAVIQAGGTIAIESDRLLLGWLDAGSEQALIGKHGIRAVHRTSDATVPGLDERNPRDRNTRQALAFFRHVKSGQYAATVEEGFRHGRTRGSMPDALPNPALLSRMGAQSTSAGKSKAGTATKSIWTNESMRGIVQVTAFEMESDGSVDANVNTWTNPTHWNTITNQILGAFMFWASEAQARGITLTFRISVWEPDAPNSAMGYEPMSRPNTDDFLWVNDIMRKQDTAAPYYLGYPDGRPGGFGANPVNPVNVFTKVEEYNEQRKYNFYTAADHSFTIFVAYNPSGPVAFTNGRGPYAYIGGPFVQVMYESGWRPWELGMVLDHEIGHIFWACDEYAPECSTCTCWGFGPRPNSSNANCAAVTSCSFSQTDCIMKTSRKTLCSVTPQQIGW